MAIHAFHDIHEVDVLIPTRTEHFKAMATIDRDLVPTGEKLRAIAQTGNCHDLVRRGWQAFPAPAERIETDHDFAAILMHRSGRPLGYAWGYWSMFGRRGFDPAGICMRNKVAVKVHELASRTLVIHRLGVTDGGQGLGVPLRAAIIEYAAAVGLEAVTSNAGELLLLRDGNPPLVVPNLATIAMNAGPVGDVLETIGSRVQTDPIIDAGEMIASVKWSARWNPIGIARFRMDAILHERRIFRGWITRAAQRLAEAFPRAVEAAAPPEAREQADIRR